MKTSYCFAALLPLGFAALLSAQTTTPSDSPHGRGHHGRGGPGGGPGFPIVRVLDADKDREISAGELAMASAAILTLDTNNDGTVSREEMRPGRPEHTGRPERAERPAGAPEGGKRSGPPAGVGPVRPVDPIMLALDADTDGNLSPAEIANASASLAALDANKDGKLTMDEFRPLPPEGASHGGKKGPHGGRK
jgi:hypothetical protein